MSSDAGSRLGPDAPPLQRLLDAVQPFVQFWREQGAYVSGPRTIITHGHYDHLVATFDAVARGTVPDNDGSSWDCTECGTNVVGPSVALPCPKCGGRMVARAGIGALLIEAQAWVERMEAALCDPREGHGSDAKCAKLHGEARHIKGLFEKISQRAARGEASESRSVGASVAATTAQVLRAHRLLKHVPTQRMQHGEVRHYVLCACFQEFDNEDAHDLHVVAALDGVRAGEPEPSEAAINAARAEIVAAHKGDKPYNPWGENWRAVTVDMLRAAYQVDHISPKPSPLLVAALESKVEMSDAPRITHASQETEVVLGKVARHIMDYVRAYGSVRAGTSEDDPELLLSEIGARLAILERAARGARVRAGEGEPK